MCSTSVQCLLHNDHLVLRLSRETEPIGDIYVIYYKELAYAVLEPERSHHLQTGEPGEVEFQFEYRRKPMSQLKNR